MTTCTALHVSAAQTRSGEIDCNSYRKKTERIWQDRCVNYHSDGGNDAVPAPSVFFPFPERREGWRWNTEEGGQRYGGQDFIFVVIGQRLIGPSVTICRVVQSQGTQWPCLSALFCWKMSLTGLVAEPHLGSLAALWQRGPFPHHAPHQHPGFLLADRERRVNTPFFLLPRFQTFLSNLRWLRWFYSVKQHQVEATLRSAFCCFTQMNMICRS